MTSSLARRIFLAHLELSYRLGRKVTLAEFGDLIAKEMGREAAFTAAAVSRWENGVQIPSLSIVEAIASVTGVDPGWISHGERTAAPGPRLRGERPVPGSAEPIRMPSAQVPPADTVAEQRHRPERRRSRPR
jgi:transcriptional regulator with XRE-family HTH domain